MAQERKDWKLYRTKYLIRAKQLSEGCVVLDSSGRVLEGSSGDYLVESSDGSLRIARRDVFEDVYVELEDGRASGEYPALANAS